MVIADCCFDIPVAEDDVGDRWFCAKADKGDDDD